jgi:branched-chain amino acid transport system ATP-binding protein
VSTADGLSTVDGSGTAKPVLTIDRLSAWYGEARVLREVSLQVPAGQVVTLVGRNGAGKTTLLRCVMGLHRQQSGRIELAGAPPLARLAPHRRARAGLGYVQDDRGIYASLSVAENLEIAPVVGPDPWPLRRIYEAFPVLHERRRFPGTKLSGGEQQMLAIARVLRTGARLLLCDEPTEGLSPLLVRRIGDILREVKAHGVTVLLIEQNLHFAATVADRHYLLAQGRVVEQLDNDEIRLRERELLAHLGI